MRRTEWNPFKEIEQFVNQMSRQTHRPVRFIHTSTGSPVSVDVTDDGDKFTVTADIPGYDKDELTVKLTDDTLTIRAEQNTETETDNEDREYLHRERRQTTVERRIPLKAPVDEDSVTSTYHNGVLTVTLPKADDTDDATTINIE